MQTLFLVLVGLRKLLVLGSHNYTLKLIHTNNITNMIISRYGIMRCTMQVNRYYLHDTATTTTTTRPFSGLLCQRLWQQLQLDQFSNSEQKALSYKMKEEKSACTPAQRCALHGYVNDTRSLPESNSCEETDTDKDNDAVDNQFLLNITYPWLVHRGGR